MNRVVITGANRGIGLAFVNLYHAQGCEVIALCRESSTELNNIGVKVVEGVDVTSEKLGALLAETFGDKKIDLLINNAGILKDEKLGAIDFDSIRVQMEVNALGPLRITECLLPNLQEGSKIALITSRMGSITDNGSGGRYGYRMSKAALNIAGVSLAKDLSSRGIAVAILHPGYVQTDMVGGSGDISTTVCTERLAQRIEDLALETSGTFWHSNGEVLPW